MESFIFQGGKTRPPATLGLQETSWKTRGSILQVVDTVFQVLTMVLICDFLKIVFVAKNISQIVTTSPTRRQSPRPSLGESLDEYSGRMLL